MDDRPTIAGIELVSPDPPALVRFYRDVLEFEERAGYLGLGETELVIRAGTGRRIPTDSRSNDCWFRHIAIVVESVANAHARLQRAGIETISIRPQRLPAWNPDSGDIEAFYFRDPDGHVLEFIAYPPGKGKDAWREADDRCFRGIDHTAIVVENTASAIGFYCGTLGLEVTATAHNFGDEQEQLSGVAGARVLVTTLGGASTCGLELLEYIEPRDGRAFPADTTADDLWAGATLVRDCGAALAAGSIARDPTGHFVRAC
jgi:catechol 2,3-dioxygenase-like lactoylglutathione lyase family enzyme